MHNICHYEYSENVNKKEVLADINEMVEHETWQEGGHGISGIRWDTSGVICKNREEAEKWIEAHDSGWYDQLAVKFYRPVRNSAPKTNELSKTTQEAYKEYAKRNGELYANRVTSAFIGCKQCGSKVARQYIKTNSCPVCRTELRPEHMLKWVAAAKNKWDRAAANEKEYIEKHSKKEVRWLVKIEYHT